MTMTCKEALELIHQILDGEAEEAALAELSAHKDQCSDCAHAWESLSGVDALLRETEGDEPDDAYFDAMAGSISARVYERQHSRKSFFAMPWIRSLGMAAACLAVGLFVGRAAFPVEITKTVTETQTVEVAGPTVEVIKEVPFEVRVEVPVEVVRWRTRTVVRHVPAAAGERAPVMVAGVSASDATPPPPAPAPTPQTRRPVTRFAAWSPGASASGASTLSADDIRVLAAGLAASGRDLDDAINTPMLASALVSGMSTVDASVDAAATTTEPRPHTQ